MAEPRKRSFKARIEDFEADDIDAFYNNSMLRVFHLEGKQRTFRIVRVQRITKQEGDEVTQRPVLRLADRTGAEHPLPFELNPTNKKTIVGIYGRKRADWIGRLITLYPTECEAFGSMQPCIRIRPFDPSTKASAPVRPMAAPPRQEQPKSEPPPAPPASGELELEDAGGNDYRDSTADDEEPPFGALLEDNSGNVIR